VWESERRSKDGSRSGQKTERKSRRKERSRRGSFYSALKNVFSLFGTSLHLSRPPLISSAQNIRLKSIAWHGNASPSELDIFLCLNDIPIVSMVLNIVYTQGWGLLFSMAGKVPLKLLLLKSDTYTPAVPLFKSLFIFESNFIFNT